MSFDTRDFRNALGRYATGVAIVTALDRQKRAHGMTINSFAAVSLEPPLVLWSIQNDSECFDLYTKAETFAVNVLSVDQLPLSKIYATKGEHLLLPEHLEVTEEGVPWLPGALARFECSLETTYEGGDHAIIIGRVSHYDYTENGKPLLFYTGNYAQLSD